LPTWHQSTKGRAMIKDLLALAAIAAFVAASSYAAFGVATM